VYSCKNRTGNEGLWIMFAVLILIATQAHWWLKI